MTDKVHPSAAAPQPPLRPPPNKSHLRSPYRPTPTPLHRRHFSCRRCFCLALCYSLLLLAAILLLTATAAAALYALYRPRHPTFSVTSLKISSFNLTTAAPDDTTHLTTRINITLSAKNPNKKAIFFYDPAAITVLSRSVILSNGSYANFTSSPGAISIIHTAMGPYSQVLDAVSVTSLKSDLKRKKGLPVEIVMDTMVGVKMEKLRMKKIGIRVKCEGIHGVVPKGKSVIPQQADASGAKCKVDLRIKIWKWTF